MEQKQTDLSSNTLRKFGWAMLYFTTDRLLSGRPADHTGFEGIKAERGVEKSQKSQTKFSVKCTKNVNFSMNSPF